MANKLSRIKTYGEIFLVATKLGLTSFGGPIAHLAYFYEEYVRRKKWLDEKSYAELVALCQFLPGPASSQVGMGIGVIRGGMIGGVIAFLGFTFPSVIALITFALLMHHYPLANAGWIHGLKIVAAAIVLHAIIEMGKKLTPDLYRKAIALFSLNLCFIWPTAQSQIFIILLSGIIGYFIYKDRTRYIPLQKETFIPKAWSSIFLLLFFLLLIGLPLLQKWTNFYWLSFFDKFFRAGALVFGGGHVVLPLLEKEFVPTGWINEEMFIAGYGASQAVPGPLFTFAAYLGTAMNGWIGGVIATIAIFLPSFLLLYGSLPFWNQLRNHPKAKGALIGVNAAVVGILIAAFYQPIWTTSILTANDFALVVVLFSLLHFWKLPPWLIVIIGIFGGSLHSFSIK